MTTGFPLIPLGIMVEILINGTWADISEFVYQRDDIQIGGGAPDETTKPTPAQMTLTLNNQDGRFSPEYTLGAYYPYIQRNTQIRLSINTQSITGNAYTGYRFWGAVAEWPPNADVSGNDVYVPITANGPFRYIDQGGGIGSALQRYYLSLTGSYAPIAYWPCEEDPNTNQIGAGIDGGTVMSITGTPHYNAKKDFLGSAPVPIVNKSTWTGLTGSFGSSGDDIYNTPGTYHWVASASTVNCIAIGPCGGGENGDPFSGYGGNAGGGGELAQETTLAVTIGNTYTFTIPAGGQGGPGGAGTGGASPGQDGTGNTVFPGDAVTVTAHPGKGGSTLAGGLGGTGSSNTNHHNGGNGGTANTGKAGAGGGSTGGTAAAGNNGSSESGNTHGAGGAAPTGGVKGGNGGDAPKGSPATGGGGGGGPVNGAGAGAWYGRAGAAGAPGSIQLQYTPASIPTNNVMRFCVLVPPHGGNVGNVLFRTLTAGTIARLDVQYAGAGGKLTLIGYNSVGTQLFTSGAQAWNLDSQTAMVSIELAPNGTGVNWAFKAIVPGNKFLIGQASGTQASATLGNVTECIVGPNGDITKTAMGQITVQYALVDLRSVSDSLNAHNSEMGIDRFIRLCTEEALGYEAQFSEGTDHWGFESSTQSWVATNCTLTNPTTTFDNVVAFVVYQSWPPEGTHSLLITANGAGAINANSPSALSGQPCLPGDVVSVNFELYTPTAVAGLSANINFWTAAGGALASVTTTLDNPTVAGELQTVQLTTAAAGAPATAAWFNVSIKSAGTLTNGVQIYMDNVRIQPRMGPQTRKRLNDFLKEVKDLEQGMMKEAKGLWGFGYRTRISMINQTPAVTLDYNASHLAEQPVPVKDDQKTKNDVTVRRHKGSKVQTTLTSGSMSINFPPKGVGRKRKHLKVIAELDAQLAALAAQLLSFGTALDERYPSVMVDLTRPEVATIMSAVAGVGCGDYIQMTNLPFWYPSATAKQMVFGYQETINTFKWTIEWNCAPESPFEITSTQLRRW